MTFPAKSIRRPLAGIGPGVRQWRQPREFRIRATAWPSGALAIFAEFAEAAAAAAATTAPAAGGNSAKETAGLSERSVADVATSIWRLRGRLAKPPDGTRSLTRHFEMAWDTLTEAGVEIRDHLNEPYDSGLSLTVIAFQPVPGLDRERVIEAVRPTVRLNDRVIQIAEVIVGTPDAQKESRS
ncbi:hypothetical protein GCM10023191_070380 [Actinoallomurus oryzae]|uniref:Uncharacterized protein n=1 Tax=Actinoallomurus oryzae TaxID=502180 RepID=A0ABP8QSP6_9ACTN